MKSELESLCVEGSAIWEAIEARLDGDEHRGLYVAPLAELLDEVRKRVDDETWLTSGPKGATSEGRGELVAPLRLC